MLVPPVLFLQQMTLIVIYTVTKLGNGNFVLNAHVSIKMREFKSNTNSD